jgi:hypothetical protein
MLRLFTAGELYDVSTIYTANDEGGDDAESPWLLTYDVLRYRLGRNYYKVFYHGTDY